jgi:hypothetical protein
VRVSPDTMTWPPCAAVQILAAVCTAIPMWFACARVG